MCGILGYIGNSLQPKTTYSLTSALFHISEVRGTDAAGFWAAGDHIQFHKEPIRTSEMIPTAQWHSVQHLNPYLFLGHARLATQGTPKVNINNQPFMTQDQNVCLIHNGKITKYHDLKGDYELESDCDSELLLRKYEANHRIEDLMLEGPTAFAIASAQDKSLWLFRNDGRPLWLIDIRKTLGQIFFCSTIDIWFKARRGNLQEKIYPLGAHEAWYLILGENIIVKRFRIEYN